MRLLNIPGITFALFFAWKVALLWWTSQPVPANDAFFYDGPVVNYLLHGRYCNPSLVEVLPISGRDIFCAYPPLHQFALLGWMSVAGTSALAAMWYHVLLLGLYAIVALAILRRLEVPPVWINLAGLFLFGITFHDRPDTLAHVFGVLAVWAFVRGGLSVGVSRGQGGTGRLGIWLWIAAGLLLLTFGASLQIGGVYALWIGMLVLLAMWADRLRFPWAVVLTFLGAFAGLVLLVRFGFPRLWLGFEEHARITPSLTGWRFPRPDDLLKTVRTAPGILLAAGGLAWLFARGRLRLEQVRSSPALLVCLGGIVAAGLLIVACLVVISPNTVHIAGYLQPIIVAGFAAGLMKGTGGLVNGRWLTGCLVAGALLVSVRAVGLSTWGGLCARDMDRQTALARVRSELDVLPDGSVVLVASAYLYDAAQRTNLVCLHSDWPVIPGARGGEAAGILRLKPAKIVLTQFDYYRRYPTTLSALSRLAGAPEIVVTDTARVKPPDAFPRWQKVVQHVAWAPVILDLKWPPSAISSHEDTTNRK